jgi:RNA polymerase sigma-70 factor (ECF subfamily)
LLSSFLDAVSTGNLGALTDLLSEDVTAWNDGGGKVRAAPRPVIGRHRVLSFVAGPLPSTSWAGSA